MTYPGMMAIGLGFTEQRRRDALLGKRQEVLEDLDGSQDADPFVTGFGSGLRRDDHRAQAQHTAIKTPDSRLFLIIDPLPP